MQAGRASVEQALERLRHLPYDEVSLRNDKVPLRNGMAENGVSFARLDLHRALRQGLPEVIFCQGKTPEQVTIIMERLASHHGRVLGTRASEETARMVQSRLPEAHYDPISRLLSLARTELPAPSADAPYALVAAAGTSDLPVAEEAAQTAEFMGSRVERAYDVGVAGIHRLLDQRERLFGASAIVSVAGMEGALTSVIGGLVACPVIGVPTSVGYGAHFGGLAPLLAMLNSCAPGVAVVNIDNGFGAGLYAHMILRQMDIK